jgi:hypothetical protein
MMMVVMALQLISLTLRMKSLMKSLGIRDSIREKKMKKRSMIPKLKGKSKSSERDWRVYH